ncbi:hypothetical protein CRG98_035015 [Punica granatum]|uniref:Uncharacterized protein n=1 Tax=Punica granatum TaxID=22663 RepID=A0A2I0ILX1_PUNGR|nr:hypothetical protein CRG98_035015 [Punica granatum]
MENVKPQHNHKSSTEPNAEDAAYAGTIDCRGAAERFNGVLISPEPNTADATGTIDSREAAKKFNGVLIRGFPNQSTTQSTELAQQFIKEPNHGPKMPKPKLRVLP